MRKTAIVLIVVLVAVSSASAFSFKSLGIETGQGFFVSADMEVIDKFDVYARVGYMGAFGFSVGAQYEVAQIKINSVTLPVKPGAQLSFGFADSTFLFGFLATCQFSFDVDCFTAFLRPGLGMMISTYSYYSYYEGRRVSDSEATFNFSIETGVAYKFN